MAVEAGGGAVLPAAVEALAADWMLEFACYCLCRHFREECPAEFQRWRDVTQALINGLSKIPTCQKKMVYVCQLLITVAEGKELEWHFKNKERISPLESALSFWTLLEKEEIKLDKLHEDIHRLLQIQAVAVHMEKGYFKEAGEILERLFTDSESDKPLRVKLATILKSKDPYVPFLQNFSYNHLISKIKSYIKLFMKENENNFLIQITVKLGIYKIATPTTDEVFVLQKLLEAATKEIECKGLGATELQKQTVNVKRSHKNSLETKQRSVKEKENITNQSPGGMKNPMVRPHSQKHQVNHVLGSLNNLQNVENNGDALAGGRKRQRWTDKEDLELKSGVSKFGVGNWAKILVHGNFNNRTSVMLKDRWRTLCRIDQS